MKCFCWFANPDWPIIFTILPGSKHKHCTTVWPKCQITANLRSETERVQCLETTKRWRRKTAERIGGQEKKRWRGSEETKGEGIRRSAAFVTCISVDTDHYTVIMWRHWNSFVIVQCIVFYVCLWFESFQSLIVFSFFPDYGHRKIGNGK